MFCTYTNLLAGRLEAPAGSHERLAALQSETGINWFLPSLPGLKKVMVKGCDILLLKAGLVLIVITGTNFGQSSHLSYFIYKWSDSIRINPSSTSCCLLLFLS